jgi:hypothetical protein
VALPLNRILPKRACHAQAKAPGAVIGKFLVLLRRVRSTTQSIIAAIQPRQGQFLKIRSITLAVKVAFVVPPISGHLNPMTTLARELQSRDHDVVIISLPDGEASVRGAGLRFLPCAAKEFPAGSLKERFRQRSKLKGDEALRAILQSAAGRTEAMLNSLPAALTAAAVDAAVLDTVLFYTTPN